MSPLIITHLNITEHNIIELNINKPTFKFNSTQLK